MKQLLFSLIFVSVLITVEGFGQVGERVVLVEVVNTKKQVVSLPMLGEKNLLIFYADPSHPRQNKSFRTYLKKHPINSPGIDSYGVVNMAAEPMLSVDLIRKMALKEIRGTNAQVYFDPKGVLAETWHLPGANRNFAIIFVNRDQVIEFYKAGQLTQQEQNQVLDLIQKYKE